MDLFDSVIPFFVLMRRIPRSSLFPYTTLFRSVDHPVDPPCRLVGFGCHDLFDQVCKGSDAGGGFAAAEQERSEEHTSELQSRENLVCRRLLEKKKQIWPGSFQKTLTERVSVGG